MTPKHVRCAPDKPGAQRAICLTLSLLHEQFIKPVLFYAGDFRCNLRRLVGWQLIGKGLQQLKNGNFSEIIFGGLGTGDYQDNLTPLLIGILRDDLVQFTQRPR